MTRCLPRMGAWPLLLAMAGSGIAVSAVAGRAGAEPPGDEEVQRRTRFIQQRLDLGTAAADRWWYAWYTIYGGLSVGQAAIAIAVTDRGLRIDNAVGAFSTSLGIVPLGLSPLQARFAADRLRALPESTPQQRRAKLTQGEDILRAAAEDELFGRSWVSHLVGNGVSLAFGVVLAVGYDRPEAGIINFAAGLALNELQILTQPTRAIDDWREYKRHGASRASEQPDVLRWMVTPQAGGLGVAGCF